MVLAVRGPQREVSDTGRGTFACFIAFGLAQGVWVAVLADVATAAGVTVGGIGLAISIGLLASFPAMRGAGAMLDRLGTSPVLLAGAALYGLGFLAAAAISGWPTLVASLVLLLGGAGVVDVAVNAAGVRYEAAVGRRVLLYLHASYSAACAVGAIGAGVLLMAGVGHREILWLAMAAVLVLNAGSVLLGLASGEGQARVSEQAGESTARGVLSPRARRLLLALVPVAFVGFFAEGVMASWGSYYLRDEFGASGLVGAAGSATFFAAMAIGRLFGARGVSSRGRSVVLRTSGIATAAGVLLIVLSTSTVPILLGFLLTGAALSNVIPLLFSVVGDTVPAESGRVLSVVVTGGYCALMIGPSVVGVLANHTSFRASIGLVAAAGVAIALFGGSLLSDRDPAAGAAGLSA